jgi:ABC-type polysaccharide/polyol phosphate transport system ATPase subunit
VSGSPAVALDRVSKRFFIYRRRAGGLKDRLISAVSGRREEREALWALRDVSLEIAPGETLGVIGPNGCGKSTLLQLVAGILTPDEGATRVNGRVTSLLELGAGFSPDLSGRDNVFLNASLHGLRRAEVLPRFDEIIAFAELERFVDTPVRNYSSGMYMRLAMAVAVHLDPEIVLIDEAFAVGDEAFQRKCLRKLKEFQERGITILLVSHDLHLVQQIATRGCLLQRGRIHVLGHPTDAVAEYHRLASEHRPPPDEQRWGSGRITIDRVETRDAAGAPSSFFRTNDPLIVAMRYAATGRVETPVFGLAVYREDGVHMTGPNTRMNAFPIAAVEGEGEVRYHVPRLPLLPGTYVIAVSAYDQDLAFAYDHRERVATFTVIEGGTLEQFGLITMHGSWSHEPRAAPASAS